MGALRPNIPEPRLNRNAYAANLNSSVLSLSVVFLTGDSTGNGDRRSEFPKFILRGYDSLLQSVCVV